MISPGKIVKIANPNNYDKPWHMKQIEGMVVETKKVDEDTFIKVLWIGTSRVFVKDTWRKEDLKLK